MPRNTKNLEQRAEQAQALLGDLLARIEELEEENNTQADTISDLKSAVIERDMTITELQGEIDNLTTAYNELSDRYQ